MLSNVKKLITLPSLNRICICLYTYQMGRPLTLKIKFMVYVNFWIAMKATYVSIWTSFKVKKVHFKRKIRARQSQRWKKTYEWQWKPGKSNDNPLSVGSYYVKYILKWTWKVYTNIWFFHELKKVMYFKLTVMALTSLPWKSISSYCLKY